MALNRRSFIKTALMGIVSILVFPKVLFSRKSRVITTTDAWRAGPTPFAFLCKSNCVEAWESKIIDKTTIEITEYLGTYENIFDATCSVYKRDIFYVKEPKGWLVI